MFDPNTTFKVISALCVETLSVTNAGIHHSHLGVYDVFWLINAIMWIFDKNRYIIRPCSWKVVGDIVHMHCLHQVMLFCL